MTPGHTVLARLRARGVPVGEPAARTILALVDGAPEHPSTTALLERAGISATTAHWRLSKASLPAPSRFYHLGRAIAAALALHRMRAASVGEVSRTFGYTDHTAVAKMCRRQFGRSAGEVRLYAGRGPAWLVDAWLERAS